MDRGVGSPLPLDERFEKVDESDEGLGILEPVMTKTTIFADVAKAEADRRVEVDGLLESGSREMNCSHYLCEQNVQFVSLCVFIDVYLIFSYCGLSLMYYISDEIALV